MELLRALGAVIERPDACVGRLAGMLELPAEPTLAEHAFLFEQQLVPCASRYLSHDGAPSEPICERMASFWRAVGATPPQEADRLPRLLGFYADLVDMQSHETDEARCHAVGRLRKAVLWEHLLTWLPAYLSKVDLIAPNVYRRWGQLLWQVAAREAWLVGPPADLPPPLAGPMTLPEPARGDAEALAAYLAAPARSGLILTPIDVRRASDALHVPAPDGTAREGFGALFRIRLSGGIEWLKVEARRWEARHERNRELLPALSDHWARRARGTRALLHAWHRSPSTAASGLSAEPPVRGTPSPGRAIGRSRSDGHRGRQA